MKAKPRSAALVAYKALTHALAPAVPYFLARREARGKEEAARVSERLGVSSLARPEGPLVWLHAASIGESLSILPLTERLIAAVPGLHVLVTTGTVTSARLMAERLPSGAVHQFVPLDHPDYCTRFLDHWRPDLAVWVESEFWPNLIILAHERGVPLALVNARITKRSWRSWKRAPAFIANLLSRFRLLMAQDRASAERLRDLGAAHVEEPGNLKHDAAPLEHDAAALAHLRAATAGRPLWLASNTHEGEERAAAEAHLALAPAHPGLLTVIVPRHPARGAAIAAELAAMGLAVARRSSGDDIGPDTQIYLGDTLGEMGLFYNLSGIAFIGGTLGAQGGHNPFEAARLDCALVTGPSDFNFAEAYAAFEKGGAMLRIADGTALPVTIGRLLDNETERQRLCRAAFEIVNADSGATDRALAALLRLLPQGAERSGDA
ncbi:Three-deoxy-D-manno-octulosonic-acid transferase domain protein [Parvibaculum lavamentivorans DS-1]|uniref:3-deoxy-D-manno-octulosonic acid transferase n=1 Tax=Parvibaculum lavamentivorans (strain DS-1 / DSM 13023 / NCIMB 13966) TaxID=402881 RepID=A7HQR5_PARL1|nr:glycosyltransferase N-terminal domain-containing protein [Parvibaculum lavamentivorans]ABS62248.1 Three-deoxy-D-manno-octulosonic-acid transferase domain protein [Parvibaculum lavamentivorans DS-1]